MGSLSTSSTVRLAGALRAGVLGWVWVLLFGCLVLRGAEAVNATFNADEFHFLHSAWMVAHGYLPYRDFWTNHSPLFIYLLKPLVTHYDENPSSLFPVARLLQLVVSLGLFGLVAALATRQRRWTAGLFAALLLTVNFTVFMPTVTLRHDSLGLACELLALLLLARGIASRRSRDFLAAGAPLGLALALSPKGLFGLTGLALGCVVHEVSSSPGLARLRALMGMMRPLTLLAVGSLGMFGLVTAILVPLEGWPLMISRVFLDSLSSPERYSPLTRYLLWEIVAEPIAWLVMLAGFGVAVRQWWIGVGRRHPAETLLLVAGLWWAVTYLFLMSSPYHQSALPCIAVLSIFGGRLLALGEAQLSSAAIGAKTVAWAACLTILVSWVAIGSAWPIIQQHPPFRRMNLHQVKMIRYVLSVTSPDDAVFDGQSAYIFRPQASYYGSLMRVIRMQIQRGDIAFDIPERCRRLSCKVVILDDNSVHLPPTVWAWIRENYVPSRPLPYVLLHRSPVAESGRSGS